MAENFINLYCEYSDPITEAPFVFHHRIAYLILSTIINNKIYVKCGYKDLYPNLWMIVIAPSGFYRKSYSLGIAQNLINAINADLICPDEYSHEGLVEKFTQFPVGTMFLYEFSRFMKMLEKNYLLSTQGLLTELFDNPAEYRRRLKKKINKTMSKDDRKISEDESIQIISKPFINILGASTIEWLNNSVKDSDIMGGFLARFLFVMSSEIKPALANQPIADQKLKSELIALLQSIGNISGEMIMTPDAGDMYGKWYEKFRNRNIETESIINPFMVRLQNYCLKFAMLETINQNPFGGLAITPKAMEEAIMMTGSYERDVKDLVENKMTFSFDEKEMKKVKLIISNKKEISRRDLLQLSHLQSRKLDEYLRTIAESNFAYKVEQKSTMNGRHIEIWKLRNGNEI